MRLPALAMLGAAIVALLALVLPIGTRDRSGPPRGIYFGWATDSELRLQILGHACPAPDTARHISAELAEGSSLDLEQVNADLGLPAEVAAMIGAGAPTATWSDGSLRISSLQYSCRSGTEGSVAIGATTLMRIGAATDQVGLVVRAADPDSALAGRILVMNGSTGPVVVESVAYAPSEFATGTLSGAAGSREQVFAIEDSVSPPVSGVQRPTQPTQWDAGYLSPSDPRYLRVRSATELGLLLGPGEMALLLIDTDSLRRTVTPRPVVLYPVVTLREVASGTRFAAGSRTPLVGVTRSWLGLRGG